MNMVRTTMQHAWHGAKRCCHAVSGGDVLSPAATENRCPPQSAACKREILRTRMKCSPRRRLAEERAASPSAMLHGLRPMASHHAMPW